MATAAELLAGISTGDDTTLVIDNYLRTIHIPKRITNLGVEHDDDVLTLDFKMPRYLDDTDLSKFAIRINYINANGDSDAYTVNDNKKVVTTDHILFSWLVGPTATAYKGTTKFIVCMKTLKSDGTIDREYNTTIASLPVLEGLEVDEYIVTQYSDIIEQWRQELFGIGDTEEANMRAVSQEEQQNIVQKGAEVLATIPEEYQETAEAAQEGIRTKADAIVCTTEGTAISVSDSSDDHVRGLRVFGKSTQITTTGKNLIHNELYTLTTNGITITVNEDKTFVVNGTATTSTFLTIHTDFNPGAGEYILSGCPSSGGVNKYILYATDSDSGFYAQDAGTGGTKFTHPGDVAPDIRLAIYEGTTVYGAHFKPMVRVASITDDTYEPYTGGVASPNPDYPQEITNVSNDGEAVVWVTGKNLLRDSNAPESHSHNGLTVDYEGNGVFHVHGTFNGTSSGTQLATSTMTMPIDPAAEYTLSAKVLSGTVPDDFHPYLAAGSDTISFKNWLPIKIPKGSVAGEKFTGTLSATATVPDAKVIKSFWLYTHNDELDPYEADFRIQVWLEKGNTSTEFEPYKETLLSVAMADGLPGIPVTSGGNYTDSDGQQWICDEVDFERGVYISRCFTETLTGFEAETNDYGTRYVKYGVSVTPHQLCTMCLCPTLPYSANVGLAGPYTDNGIRITPTFRGGTIVARWDDTVIESLTVTYLRENPIETPLTAEEIAAFKMLRSNYPNTTVLNDSGAHMELKYNVDTKTYVDNGIKQTVSEVMEAIANGSY